MLTMYGIKNCDTIKKARRWLEAHQIEYRFHDYRADGLDRTFWIPLSPNWAGKRC
jgi:arsenate reductase-like glutaredoxin family protein